MTTVELTAQQYNFLALLLDGATIKDAAEQLAIGRRTATRWLEEGQPVRLEYSRRRADLAAGHDARYRKLQARVLEIMETALGAESPPDVRIETARFLY